MPAIEGNPRHDFLEGTKMFMTRITLRTDTCEEMEHLIRAVEVFLREYTPPKPTPTRPIQVLRGSNRMIIKA